MTWERFYLLASCLNQVGLNTVSLPTDQRFDWAERQLRDAAQWTHAWLFQSALRRQVSKWPAKIVTRAKTLPASGKSVPSARSLPFYRN